MIHVRSTAILLVLIALSSVFSACHAPDAVPASSAVVAAEAAEPAAPSEHLAQADEHPTSMPSAERGCAAYDDLFAMDPRQPVPLQPMMAWHQKQNMMEHLVAIQQITAALAEQDWDGVAEASARIESSPQMQMMCQHMGAGAPGFTDLALEFHRRADAIAPAAQAQDTAAVLRATSSTLQACTSCHAAYRQDVVDAATWQALTGSAHDPAGMHGGH